MRGLLISLSKTKQTKMCLIYIYNAVQHCLKKSFKTFQMAQLFASLCREEIYRLEVVFTTSPGMDISQDVLPERKSVH